MAALKEQTRGLFTESVRSALEAWPALQVAVENGFGGAYSQQKADWMVTAVAQYLYDNVDLESEEVEELMADLMYNEFDTVIEDGSLSEVSRQIWTFFSLCQRGRESEVRGHIQQLVQKKCDLKVKAVQGKSSGEEAGDEDSEEDDATEAMDCDNHAAGSPCGNPSPRRQTGSGAAAGEEEEEEEPQDSWTVVRRRKK